MEPRSGYAAESRRAGSWRGWAATVLVLVGAVRIVATYRELSETVDEVAHVGAGMEWLAQGRYTFELQHPPLARIAAATGPYLLGIRAQNQSNLWFEGRHVLYADNAYVRNLAAARLGILPFFAIAAFFLWRVGRAAFGSNVALGAVACFTLLPPVLAHYGLATTDGPFVAMFAAAVYALLLWLRGPSVRNGVALGAATSLAVVSKFSAIPYLGVVAVLLVAARVWSMRTAADAAPRQSLGTPEGSPEAERYDWSWRRTLASLAVAGVVGFFVAWAVYRFSVGTIRGVAVPLAEIPKGILEVVEHNRRGHPAYFLGEVRANGSWYFFPVMLALKTPLVALVLGVVGFAVSMRRAARSGEWIPLVPVIVATSVLGVGVTSGITIGLRHVLPFYLALALAVGVAWDWIWARVRTRRARGALIGVTLAETLSTIAVHPDYLSHFNVLAGADPSRLVADSDLDWGQDMFRLAREVRARSVDTLNFGYIGTADLSPIIGVPVRYWDGTTRPGGWVAVTETFFRRGQITVRRGAYVIRPDAFAWLDSAAAFTRVGSGIRLYHLPRSASAAPR